MYIYNFLNIYIYVCILIKWRDLILILFYYSIIIILYFNKYIRSKLKLLNNFENFILEYNIMYIYKLLFFLSLIIIVLIDFCD